MYDAAGTLRVRFNDASADRRGLQVLGVEVTDVKTASMMPRLIAEDYGATIGGLDHRVHASMMPRLIAEDYRPLHCARLNATLASMMPRLIAEDYIGLRLGEYIRPKASMMPRLIAEDYQFQLYVVATAPALQ